MRTATSRTASNEPAPAWWPKTLLDEDEAAELLGLSVRTLQDWRSRRTRTITYHKLGECVRYNPDDLWRWLCANTRPAAVCA